MLDGQGCVLTPLAEWQGAIRAAGPGWEEQTGGHRLCTIDMLRIITDCKGKKKEK